MARAGRRRSAKVVDPEELRALVLNEEDPERRLALIEECRGRASAFSDIAGLGSLWFTAWQELCAAEHADAAPVLSYTPPAVTRVATPSGAAGPDQANKVR